MLQCCLTADNHLVPTRPQPHSVGPVLNHSVFDAAVCCHLADVRLDTKLNSVMHLACNGSTAQRRPNYPWPVTYHKKYLTFAQHSNEDLQLAKASCSNGSIPGLSVALARSPDLGHFGHRMLVELPALYALRLHLLASGVDVSHIRVIYTDSLGQPAW